MMAVKRNLLIVVSAPSGAGKTTLCDRLLSDIDGLSYSVSCTTRAPRGKEQDGVEYHFLGKDEFMRRVRAGDFLEYAEVHGNLYGTLRESVEQALADGHSVLMDIDVQGARQIRDHISRLAETDPLRQAFVDVFIEPPSLDVLRRRLTGRGEDDREEIERRLVQAAVEMQQRHAYRYRIVNDSLETAYAAFRDCIMGQMSGR